MSETELVSVGSLKVGKLVVIDGEPCRIVNISVSKPGKHGSAKARVEGISLFTGNKKNFIKGTGDKVEIPIVDKRQVQVIAILGDNLVQVMDLETYETYELEVSSDFEQKDKIEPGSEIEVHDVMGKKLLARVIKAE